MKSISLSQLKYLYLQERVQAKDPPSHYLAKLRTYLDPTASRSHRVRFVLFFSPTLFFRILTRSIIKRLLMYFITIFLFTHILI